MDNHNWKAQWDPENIRKQTNVKTQLCKKRYIYMKSSRKNSYAVVVEVGSTIILDSGQLLSAH